MPLDTCIPSGSNALIWGYEDVTVSVSVPPDHALTAVVGKKSELVIRPLLPRLKKLAAFAYVAERYGYGYAGHAPGTAAVNNPGFVFRRAADARERAVLLTAGRPGGGIALPGVMPGPGLMPTPAGRQR